MIFWLADAVAEPTPKVQLTAVVPVFWNATTAPAGRATLADEFVAVMVAKVPAGANPDIEAETVALTQSWPELFCVTTPGLPGVRVIPGVPHVAVTRALMAVWARTGV